MLNFLTGERSLRRQRDLAQDFAQEFYGGQARALSPVRLEAVRSATEGIGQATEGRIRESATRNIMTPIDFSTVGGSQGAAISMASQQGVGAMGALADIESNIAMANIETQQQGLATEAQTRAEQTRLEAIQNAAIRQADMEFEAERSSRRQELFATALGLGTAFAPEIGSAFGNMFGTNTSESIVPGLNNVISESEIFDPTFDFLDEIQFEGEMMPMPGQQQPGMINPEDDTLVDAPSPFPVNRARQQLRQQW